MVARLLGILILILGGWAAWTYVLRPALQVPEAAVNATATPTVVLPTPTAVAVTDGNSAIAYRAQDFLAAWAAGRYDMMYRDLAPSAQQAISGTAFSARYKGIAAEATISSVHPSITAIRQNGDHATVETAVALVTTALGPITYTVHLPLVNANGRWGVDWTPAAIFPGLGPAYRVHMFNESATRGSIVDRTGQILATQGDEVQIGVVPQQISNEKTLLSFLSNWLHMPPAAIQAMYHVSWAVAHPDEFVPIAQVTSVQWDAVQQQAAPQLSNGLEFIRGSTLRIYPRLGLASPLIGYVQTTADGATLGVTGLEHWADRYLRGHDGAKLGIATAPDYGYIASTLKERPKADGDTLRLTLDTTLQTAAEQALAGQAGAVVALRPSDGAVLAMASTPGFDPNLFAQGTGAGRYLASPFHPLINRATTGQYPLGSVFKIVTMGAALEKANYTAQTTMPGPAVWYGLGANNPKHDWNPYGHGIVSLHEAFVQSCDTCFYQIGQQLDNMNSYLLPDYARAWGFGAPTGIVGVREGAGIVPDPHWTLATLGQQWVPGDPVDLAIGQSFLEVTPLQVAQMLAAVGNGGTIYRPYVVKSITAPGGAVMRSYGPVVSRHLPISPQHLRDIRDAMLGVTQETYGTASDKFAGFSPSVAGKTGTAETVPGQNADAWFVALAPADHPTIALVVMVEHGGEGAATAAPLARQILHAFFTAPADRDLSAANGKGPSNLNVP